jgi:hypothetical protein
MPARSVGPAGDRPASAVPGRRPGESLGQFRPRVTLCQVDLVLGQIPGLAEVGVAEVGLAKVGVAEDGAAEIGPVEVGPAEVGPFKVSPAEVGPFKVGPMEVGSLEIGPVQSK